MSGTRRFLARLTAGLLCVVSCGCQELLNFAADGPGRPGGSGPGFVGVWQGGKDCWVRIAPDGHISGKVVFPMDPKRSGVMDSDWSVTVDDVAPVLSDDLAGVAREFTVDKQRIHCINLFPGQRPFPINYSLVFRLRNRGTALEIEKVERHVSRTMVLTRVETK